MQVSFDTENFRNHAQGLISVLGHLRYTKACSIPAHDDIESITCRTPSIAYKYTRYVAKQGISAKAEEVFLKNPKIGIQYLSYIKRDHFLDDKVQKRFHKKMVKNPTLALFYCRVFKKRLTEDEEVVFLKSMVSMWNYAKDIIKGAFPEKIHNMIVLKSYEDMDSYDKHRLKEYLKMVETGVVSVPPSPFR